MTNIYLTGGTKISVEDSEKEISQKMQSAKSLELDFIVCDRDKASRSVAIIFYQHITAFTTKKE